jgi:hypothetical protein
LTSRLAALLSEALTVWPVLFRFALIHGHSRYKVCPTNNGNGSRLRFGPYTGHALQEGVSGPHF